MKTLLASAAVLALSGCAAETMKTDDASTAAVRSALAAHVIDPAAGRAAPVTGLDGRAARQAQERYEKSFGARESGQAYTPDMGTQK